MTSYEPDPKTAQIFARYKRAHEAERELKPGMRDAAADAIRAGASNQELAALTDLTPEFFRKLAIEIGVDNRRKAPTVGREADAKRAKVSARIEPQGAASTGVPSWLRNFPAIATLTFDQAREQAARLEATRPEWFRVNRAECLAAPKWVDHAMLAADANDPESAVE